MLSDLRFAFRALGKSPGFTAVAVLTMAVAIGACTALFSVLQAVVLKPLPYPEPDRLVSLWAENPERNLSAPAISWAKYEAYRAHTDVFAAISMSANNGFTFTDGTGEPEQVLGLQASANFLLLLGLAPSRGRTFTDAEDAAGGPNVALISARLWRTRFGGDAAILGRAVQIDGAPYTVVGVLPERMPVPYQQTDVMVPRPLEVSFLTPQTRNAAIVHQAIARLAPGVTLAQANLRLAEMAAQFKAANPEHIDASNRNELRTLAQQVLGNLDRPFWTLTGAVVAVLLIACANIANLFLARVSARHKEIAVRLSLGARRVAVVRQFLTESLLFSVAAGALGVLFAWWSLQGVVGLAGPQLPRGDEIALDPNVLGFALLLSFGSALLIGIYPAIQASRTDVQTVLKDTGRGAGGGSAAKAFRHLLVVAQVALSLALLIAATLLVLSFARLQRSPLGFETDGRAFGLINLPAAKYGKPELTREFYRQLDEKLREAPELAGGGAIFGLPLGGVGAISPYAVQGRPVLPVQDRPLASVRMATAGYFAALGIQVKEGRAFTPDDRFGGENVAVVNETLARKLFPGESALDHAFLLGAKADVPARIVGVIRDVKAAGPGAPVPEEIYFARDQRGGAFMSVVGRAKPGLAAAAAIPVLRRVVASIDPQVAVANPQTLDQLVAQSVGVQRLTMTLLFAFAAIAALLAAVGLYSVMAYAVTQRTSEIGVRMALGATRGRIVALVLRAGAAQVGIGLAAGLAVALSGTRALRQILFEVSPSDPVVFASVAVLFALVAAGACWIPARRAAKVDPLVALRAE